MTWAWLAKLCVSWTVVTAVLALEPITCITLSLGMSCISVLVTAILSGPGALKEALRCVVLAIVVTIPGRVRLVTTGF